MNGTTSPLNIAILINGFKSRNTPRVHASFESVIASASDTPPQIDFYDPIVAQIYPDPAKYDLIVLSGGTADPMGGDAWVLKMQDFIRNTTRDFPRKKLLGICWGHQTICVSFGGVVGNMLGPEIGVTRLDLTEEGKRFLQLPERIYMHEFHRREIKVPPEGFKPLLEGSQSLINEENTVLTFQAHPEMNEELAKRLLKDIPSYMGVDELRKEIFAEKMEIKHDGIEIWRRILQWVKE